METLYQSIGLLSASGVRARRIAGRDCRGAREQDTGIAGSVLGSRSPLPLGQSSSLAGLARWAAGAAQVLHFTFSDFISDGRPSVPGGRCHGGLLQRRAGSLRRTGGRSERHWLQCQDSRSQDCHG